MLEGGCLCGAVRYRIAGGAPPLARSRCHCRSCRLASGAPSVAWIVVRRADLTFSRGEPSSFRSSLPVLRSFCGACGTPLGYQHDDSPDTIDVTTASLDHPELFAPTREIWLEQRLPWQPLDPTLAHYARDSEDAAGVGQPLGGRPD